MEIPKYITNLWSSPSLRYLDMWTQRNEGESDSSGITQNPPESDTSVLEADLEAKGSPFKRLVWVVNAKGGHSYAVALLDTQCHKNWISKCLVDRLGKGEDISEEFHPPIVRDVSGHEVASCGTISLEWMWGPEGTKVFDCKFFVFTNSDHLDVIFGVEYIIAQGLIDTPRDVIAPLTPHKKQDTKEAREMALRKEEQRKEKAALRAARDQAAQQSRQEQASGTSISQNSRAGAS